MNCFPQSLTRRRLFPTIVLLLLPLPAVSADAATLTFAGSGTNIPVVRLLAEAFHRKRPDIEIRVPDSIGSTGAVRAVSEGAIAAGLISRPLREKERGLGLTVVEYGRTPLVIAANPSVTDENITGDQLVAIYRGTKTRWKNGREIIVLTREPGDSAIDVLTEKVPGFGAAYADGLKKWTILYRDQEMNRMLARTPWAIGISDSGAIATDRLSITSLKFNGVAPSAANVASGKYPLIKTMSFVFKQDRLPREAAEFIEFVLSPEGGRILKANGYLPAAGPWKKR